MAARTVAPPADRVHASADVTVFDAGGIDDRALGRRARTVRWSPRATRTPARSSRAANETLLRYGDYQLRVDHPFAGGQATLFAFGSLDDVGWTNPGPTWNTAPCSFTGSTCAGGARWAADGCSGR